MTTLSRSWLAASLLAATALAAGPALARGGDGGHGGLSRGGASFAARDGGPSAGHYAGHYGGGYRGGYYRGGWGPRGYWGPGPFWGLGLGLGVGAVVYSSGYPGPYYRGYYGPTYYGVDGIDGYVEAPAVVVTPAPAYVAVDPPVSGRVLRSGQPVPSSARAPEPIFYPRNGQSAAVLESDRRECNRWATSQAGAMADASIFQRATFACMEGRGYTVK